jgi:inorganic pyrophosphatase
VATQFDLPASPEPGVVNVVIESPAGADAKIKWEPQPGVFTLSRPLPLGLRYPHDWGFVPGTKAEDGDPLDALVISDVTSFPGVVIRARPLGVVRLEQNRKNGGGRERNDRIVALPVNATRREASSFRDLPGRVREEIEQFFVSATRLEKKDPVVLGWGDPDEVWDLIRRAREPQS